MKRDLDGFPKIGSNSGELGVRVPPDPYADVVIDENGLVAPNDRGMSVARHWSDLPPHRIPKRLNNRFSAKQRVFFTGSNTLACFRMGEGSFEPGLVTDSLALVLKPNKIDSGVVVPRLSVPIRRFQEDLAETRFSWIQDENE